MSSPPTESKEGLRPLPSTYYFAQELLDNIVDCLSDDFNTLFSLARTSSRFLKRVRSYTLRSVSLEMYIKYTKDSLPWRADNNVDTVARSKKRLEEFIEIFSRAECATNVRYLKLRFAGSYSSAYYLRGLIDSGVINNLTKLQSVDISCRRCETAEGLGADTESLYDLFKAVGPSVKQLSIGFVNFGTFWDFKTLLCAFPNLSSLALRRIALMQLVTLTYDPTAGLKFRLPQSLGIVACHDDFLSALAEYMELTSAPFIETLRLYCGKYSPRLADDGYDEFRLSGTKMTAIPSRVIARIKHVNLFAWIPHYTLIDELGCTRQDKRSVRADDADLPLSQLDPLIQLFFAKIPSIETLTISDLDTDVYPEVMGYLTKNRERGPTLLMNKLVPLALTSICTQNVRTVNIKVIAPLSKGFPFAQVNDILSKTNKFPKLNCVNVDIALCNEYGLDPEELRQIVADRLYNVDSLLSVTCTTHWPVYRPVDKEFAGDSTRSKPVSWSDLWLT
ncbi:hypothetical protein K474DRAFT_1701279 [Panus rudis PR-1116 ss-1]|nr:hypothetical protein K474DRAFT_1701279 [Panus rudis PR-1116 ss-1]